MAEDERRVGPPVDADEFRKELKARIAKKAAAHERNKADRKGRSPLSRGYRPEN